MKNLKFHTIVLGFISLTSIPHVHAMDNLFENIKTTTGRALSAAASAAATTATDATHAVVVGIQRKMNGRAALLEDELDHPSKATSNLKDRCNNLNASIDDLYKANDIATLVRLLTKVASYNNAHKTEVELQYSMNPAYAQLLREPLANYYAAQKKASLEETDKQVMAMLKRWKEEREELIALAEVERARLDAISKTIRFVQGTSPDDMQLSRELDALLAKKRCDEHILIPAPVRSNDTSKSEKSTQTHQDDEIDTSKTHNSISTTTTTTTATASKSDLVPTKQDAAIPSPSKSNQSAILEEKSNTVPVMLSDASSSAQPDDNDDDDDDDTEIPSTPNIANPVPEGAAQPAVKSGTPAPTSVMSSSQLSNRSKTKNKKGSNNNLAALQHQEQNKKK